MGAASGTPAQLSPAEADAPTNWPVVVCSVLKEDAVGELVPLRSIEASFPVPTEPVCLSVRNSPKRSKAFPSHVPSPFVENLPVSWRSIGLTSPLPVSETCMRGRTCAIAEEEASWVSRAGHVGMRALSLWRTESQGSAIGKRNAIVRGRSKGIGVVAVGGHPAAEVGGLSCCVVLRRDAMRRDEMRKADEITPFLYRGGFCTVLYPDSKSPNRFGHAGSTFNQAAPQPFGGSSIQRAR